MTTDVQAQPDELQPRLTLAEVAALEKVSVFTVRRWVKAGQLRAIRLGRSYVVRREDLLAFEKRRLG